MLLINGNIGLVEEVTATPYQHDLDLAREAEVAQHRALLRAMFTHKITDEEYREMTREVVAEYKNLRADIRRNHKKGGRR